MSDHEQDRPSRIPARQLRAMTAMEVLGAVYERTIRGPAWRRLAAYVVARAIGEWSAHSRFPRVMMRVWMARSVMQVVAPHVATSTTVVHRLGRNLAEHPLETQARLARWCAAVRATRLLHRLEWELSLRGAVLKEVELEGVHTPIWDGAHFDRASLTDVTLRGSARDAVFDDAVLRNVMFVGAALNGTSWQGAVLQDVIIAAADLRQSQLAGAALRDCTLIRVDLRGCNLADVSMARVVFERCDLTAVDFGSVAMEDVDFVACVGIEAEDAARTATGALPRSFMASSDGPRPAVVGRYADAMTRSTPPLGYRVQTLLRSVALWISLGGGYQKARRELAARDPQEVDLVLPRSRVWGGLRILLSWDRQDGVDQFVGQIYADVRRAVLALHPEAEDERPLPQMVVVDGDRPMAELVIVGDHDHLVVSGGLLVLAIRLARYCIGWILPHAISYMDIWPVDNSVAGRRAALTSNLKAFAAIGHDVSGLPRIQITGMRDTQATSLAMTFLAFVLAHEIAHALEPRGAVPTVKGASADRELAADVFACRLLAGEDELDGDAELRARTGQQDTPDGTATDLEVAPAQ